jgi:hypothetical protein
VAQDTRVGFAKIIRKEYQDNQEITCRPIWELTTGDENPSMFLRNTSSLWLMPAPER